MKENYNAILESVLASEGGYSNDPGDPGGPTRFGITIFDVRMYVKKDATAKDVKALTLDQAKQIYELKYWNKVNGRRLPAGVDYCVFDYAVNSGVVRAARKLQEALGVTADGKIGPITVKAAERADPDNLIDDICDERIHFLRGLKTWPLFGRGWNTRVQKVRRLSHKMAADYHFVPEKLDAIS